ncbi:MAG TPA: hypothetical protein VJY62_17020 [Bacteroidia bacterium]|nr:hypothetical protein [Bacteroidia bacterium]
MKLKISFRQQVSESVKQRVKLLLAASMGGFAIFTFIIFLTYNNAGIMNTALAVPGRDGCKIISTPNTILNECTSLTSDAFEGGNSIAVANAYLNSDGRFTANLTSGDLVMIIQMRPVINPAGDSLQGMNTAGSCAGNFEFAEVLNVPSATKIILKSGISNSYKSAGNVQVIRVPRYSTFTITPSGSVTAQPWNGLTGGIVAIEVKQHILLNGSVNVDGKGFNGNEGRDWQQECSTEKIFMGMGGCKSVETGGPGGVNGGGLVYLISGDSVSGSGTVSANSENGGREDGRGGGTVVIYSKGIITGITIDAGSGMGENINFTEGSMGYISVSNSTGITKNISGSSNGKTSEFNGIIGPTPTFPYSSGAPLPIELTRFNGEAKNDKVELTWTTSAEINNDYFTIEKSTNGITFISYGKIEGAGNTTAIQNYSYHDLNPSAGMNYYRLKQTDFNGRNEYFKIIGIDFRADS